LVSFFYRYTKYHIMNPKKQPAPSEIPTPNTTPDVRPGKTETPDEPVITPEKPIRNPGVPEPAEPPGVQPPTPKPEPEAPTARYKA
jgi:hypothetical protein